MERILWDSEAKRKERLERELREGKLALEARSAELRTRAADAHAAAEDMQHLEAQLHDANVCTG